MNANDSAFPVMPPIDLCGIGSAGGYPYPEAGLTKRELFAAMAMQAIIGTCNGPALLGLDGAEPITAKAAVRCADALLAALEAQ